MGRGWNTDPHAHAHAHKQCTREALYPARGLDPAEGGQEAGEGVCLCGTFRVFGANKGD